MLVSLERGCACVCVCLVVVTHAEMTAPTTLVGPELQARLAPIELNAAVRACWIVDELFCEMLNDCKLAGSSEPTLAGGLGTRLSRSPSTELTNDWAEAPTVVELRPHRQGQLPGVPAPAAHLA